MDARRNWVYLRIFDYLSESKATPKPNVKKPYSVLYAGALNVRKNTFLYEVGEYIHSFSFNLYGNGFEIDKAKGKNILNTWGL